MMGPVRSMGLGLVVSSYSLPVAQQSQRIRETYKSYLPHKSHSSYGCRARLPTAP
jgi:hypothetical protein